MKRIDTPAAAAALLRSKGFTILEDEPVTAAPVPPVAAEPAPAKRRGHRWVKLRIHRYICRTCGTGKVNSFEDGCWIVTYHLPDGTAVVTSRVPACETGPKTEIYLKHYREKIEATPLRKPRADAEASA